jgi:tetratricopeptide (TPR) repeat protein
MCWIVAVPAATLSGAEWVQRGATLVEFTILGRIQVRIAGRESTGVSKPWLLLATLLALPGKQVSYKTLVDWVWTDEEERPRNLHQTFHTYAARIRDILRNSGVQLITSNGTLRLVVDRMLIDYHRFRDVIDQARKIADKGERTHARDLVLQAMELWTGPPLAELQTAYAESWRRNATNSHWIPATKLLVKLYLELDEPELAIARLDDVQDEHPDNIAFGKYRIMALYRLGRRSDGHDYANSLRRRYLADADDEGAEELRRFHADIRRRDARAAASKVSEKDRPPAVLGLPHVVPDFVGRERLLSQLDAVAVDASDRLRATVVCLVGASGAGKTAAATYWARARHDEHGDSAILVDLHGFADGRITSPAAAIDELLETLGFPISRIETPTGRATKLRELLSSRPTTVVLDNARDSKHVQPLLPYLSSSFVIVTTRQQSTGLLRDGARNLSVPLLSADDATELLARRIGDRAAADRAAVAELAGLCDGLPIMLTFVGHQVAMNERTAIRDFVDRFRDPDALLALGADGDDADSSPRMAFATSYRALGTAQRRMFRLLGLHPGADFDVPAAAALAGLPADECRGLLGGLAAIHLIEQGSTLDRWRLHDLFRAYAASLAGREEPADDREAARRRLLDFFLHTAYRADRRVFAHRSGVPMPPVPRDIVPLDFVDEHAAARWCVGERRNLSAAVGLAADGFPEHGWRFPHVIEGIFKRYGFRAELRIALDRGIEAAIAVGNSEAEGATRNDAGLLALEAGEVDSAREYFHLAAYIAQSTRSAKGLASSRVNMARLAVAEGKVESGMDHYRTALRAAEAEGNTHACANVTRSLGDIHRDHLRRYESAIQYYHEALHLYDLIGHRDGQVETLTALSTTYLRRDMRDDPHMAVAVARRAVDTIVTGMVDIVLEQRALFTLADALLGVRAADGALAHAGRAVELARRSHEAGQEAAALDLLARALRNTGRPAEAIDAWRQSAAIYRDMNDTCRLELVERRVVDLAAGMRELPTTRDGSRLEDPNLFY